MKRHGIIVSPTGDLGATFNPAAAKLDDGRYVLLVRSVPAGYEKIGPVNSFTGNYTSHISLWDAQTPTGPFTLLDEKAIAPDQPLKPYAEEIWDNYRDWIFRQKEAGIDFSEEQREWLDRMAEHIATSLAIEPEDFQDGWFGQHGSLGRAHQLFGAKLQPLLAELNERLAA